MSEESEILSKDDYIDDDEAIAALAPFEYEKEDGGYKITAVKDKSLRELTLPYGVTTVADGALDGCDALERVTIPSSLRTVLDFRLGTKALNFTDVAAWCGIRFGIGEVMLVPEVSVSTICLNGEPVTDLVIPEGVTEINEYAFSGAHIRSLTLPDSLKQIDSGAFSGCRNLEEISFGQGLENIKPCAFEDCRSIKRINAKDLASWSAINFEDVGTNPLSYGGELFINGEPMKDIAVPEGALRVGSHCYAGFSEATELTVPSTVREIGHGAFAGCTGLRSVSFNGSPDKLGMSAFERCTALKEISLPGSLTKLEYNTFGDCKGLTRVVLNEGTENIAGHAFANCGSLKSIVLPKSLKGVYMGAFDGCDSLTDIYYRGTKKEWKRIHIEQGVRVGMKLLKKGGNLPFLKAKVHFEYSEPDK